MAPRVLGCGDARRARRPGGGSRSRVARSTDPASACARVRFQGPVRRPAWSGEGRTLEGGAVHRPNAQPERDGMTLEETPFASTRPLEDLGGRPIDAHSAVDDPAVVAD